MKLHRHTVQCSGYAGPDSPRLGAALRGKADGPQHVQKLLATFNASHGYALHDDARLCSARLGITTEPRQVRKLPEISQLASAGRSTTRQIIAGLGNARGPAHVQKRGKIFGTARQGGAGLDMARRVPAEQGSRSSAGTQKAGDFRKRCRYRRGEARHVMAGRSMAKLGAATDPEGMVSNCPRFSAELCQARPGMADHGAAWQPVPDKTRNCPRIFHRRASPGWARRGAARPGVAMQPKGRDFKTRTLPN